MTSAVPTAVVLPCGDKAKWAQPLDTNELSLRVAHCRAAAPTTRAKGQRLEHLLAWLLSHLPGVVAQRSNTFSQDGAQEIDILFWNEMQEGGFPAPSGAIAGECKNWERPVDSSDVAWFDWKMRLGGVTFGVLLAANGVTLNGQRRDFAAGILTAAQGDTPPRRILVLDLSDIEALTSTSQLRDLLINKQLALAARTPFS